MDFSQDPAHTARTYYAPKHKIYHLQCSGLYVYFHMLPSRHAVSHKLAMDSIEHLRTPFTYQNDRHMVGFDGSRIYRIRMLSHFRPELLCAGIRGLRLLS